MPDDRTTGADPFRQAPHRWSRAKVAAALDSFGDPNRVSQRQCAQQQGIPHATFNYWVHHHAPPTDDPVAAFFCGATGEQVLRRIVLAALTTFSLQGACGIRLIAAFLERSQLHRFVATSRGALQALATQVESDLVAFRDCQQPDLARQMKPKTITLVPDEHFHSGQPCLVAVEPVANFILVECYRDKRDADTWKQAIDESTTGMPLTIVQMTSDQASALVCCAQKGFQALHSPDLFHGQRDLLRPVLLPLSRPIQKAEKDLEKAKHRGQQLDGPADELECWDDLLPLIEAVRQEHALSERLEQLRERKEEAVEHVRGISDDYHPFDRETGGPVTAQEVGKRLNAHVDRLEELVQEAGLAEKAKQAVNKSRTWVSTLMGVVAWFWCQVHTRMEQLDLSEEQERIVREKLLAGQYWSMASGRASTAEERERLKSLAKELTEQAWRERSLSSLSQHQREELSGAVRDVAGLFQRSSSCVEGRNGRLSLQHHGHSRVSQRRLKALTVIHNYVIKRPDGTTAAERFFGQKHTDAFAWLLERMPDLPRPAPKRTKPATSHLP